MGQLDTGRGRLTLVMMNSAEPATHMERSRWLIQRLRSD